MPLCPQRPLPYLLGRCQRLSGSECVQVLYLQFRIVGAALPVSLTPDAGICGRLLTQREEVLTEFLLWGL